MIYILFFGLCCMFVTAYLMNQKDIFVSLGHYDRDVSGQYIFCDSEH